MASGIRLGLLGLLLAAGSRAEDSSHVVRTRRGCTCSYEDGGCTVRDARQIVLLQREPANPPNCPCEGLLYDDRRIGETCGGLVLELGGRWTAQACDGGEIWTSAEGVEYCRCDRVYPMEIPFRQEFAYRGQQARVQCQSGRPVVTIPTHAFPVLHGVSDEECRRRGGDSYDGGRNFIGACRCAGGRILPNPWTSCAELEPRAAPQRRMGAASKDAPAGSALATLRRMLEAPAP